MCLDIFQRVEIWRVVSYVILVSEIAKPLSIIPQLLGNSKASIAGLSGLRAIFTDELKHGLANRIFLDWVIR